jgi:hypothetical protein
MSMRHDGDDQIEPALEKAQAELAKHLDEACETGPDDVTHGSVDELLRLEEELLAAARAADEAVRLRRRLAEQRRPGPNGSDATAAAPSVAPPPSESGGRVREFRDRQGVAWRVWEVRPGLGRPLIDLKRYLGDYVDGWLAFGCLDNDDLRKRLPTYPANWLELPDQELDSLLNRAIDVRRKAARAPSLDASA